MNYYDLSHLLATLILPSAGCATFFGSMCVLEQDIESYETTTSAMALASLISLSGSIASYGAGLEQAYQEAMSYVQSLSTEELENLSYDLIEANVSASHEEDLSERTKILSDTDLFSSDELQELFGESVAEYLKEISYTNYDEYKIILETLSDGNYIDGEVLDELNRDSIVKSLRL